MKSLLRLATITLLLTLSIAAAQQPPITLRIGDKAPSLAGLKSIKGTAPGEYQQGKIYLLDFWATWCGLCPSTYPVLSRIATSEEYAKDVVVVGIDTWETRHKKTYDLEEIVAHVKKHEDKVQFNMLVDDETSTVGNAFLKASGAPGLPTMVIVDRDGTIAWIRVGATLVPKHEEDVENALRQVVAGTFDRKAHREEFEKFVEEVRKPRPAEPVQRQ